MLKKLGTWVGSPGTRKSGELQVVHEDRKRVCKSV